MLLCMGGMDVSVVGFLLLWSRAGVDVGAGPEQAAVVVLLGGDFIFVFDAGRTAAVCCWWR